MPVPRLLSANKQMRRFGNENGVTRRLSCASPMRFKRHSSRVMGRFPFEQKILVWNFGYSMCMWRMERYFPVGWSNPSQVVTFQVSSENTNSKTRENVLLLLELLDDSEVEYDGILRGDDDFFSVASCYMRRNLNRVCGCFESTIPMYFQDEFKSKFRMAKDTWERLFVWPCQQEEYHLVTDLGELRSHLQINLNFRAVTFPVLSTGPEED